MITGATGGGIGSSLVTHFAALGTRVLANSRTKHAFANAAVAQGWPRSVFPLITDARNGEELSALVEAKSKEGLVVDTLICNAATDLPHESIDCYSNEQWEIEIETILSSAFFACRAVVPTMKAMNFGRITFITSSAASRGSWGRGVGYTAAKAGLEGMSKQLALELGSYGITCNCISPSQIDTPRIRRGGRKTDSSLRAYGQRSVPIGRVGVPADIVSAVEFQVSRYSGYVTGQTMQVDGGSSLASLLTREVRKDD